jgi:uncharacterized protein YicC (UPF0701 family)
LDLVTKRHPGVLKKFGGHAMAAGCTLDLNDFDTFDAAFQQVAQECLDPSLLNRTILSDGPLGLEYFNVETVQHLDAQVWGQAFEAPVFCDAVEVVSQRLVGSQQNESAWPQPQAGQLMRLANLQNTVISWLPQARPLSVNEVMQWCKGAAIGERLDEVALQAAKQAVAGLMHARAREGERLVQVLHERISRLYELAAQAEPLVPVVVQKQQQRFLDRWQEALTATDAAHTVDPEALKERALNEAAAFAIRIDVAEELARLRSHLDEITRLLKKGGEVGKRLDFLIQELLREANTLGSKAASLELTNVSVEMKVAIEQMREQVQNLE